MARVCDLEEDCNKKASGEIALSLLKEGKSYKVDVCQEHGERLVNRGEEVVSRSLVTDAAEREAMLDWLLDRKLIERKQGRIAGYKEQWWIDEGRKPWLEAQKGETQQVEAQKVETQKS